VNSIEYKTDGMEGKVTRYTDDAVDSAEVIIQNFQGQYTTTFSKGDTIIIYSDFVDGTHKIFEGTIWDIITQNRPDRIVLKGQGYAREAKNRKVYKSYTTPTEISAIFKALVSDYLPTHTYTNVATTTTYITISWNGKSVFECFQDLMAKLNNTYTFYCDFDKDWHMFEKGTVTSLLESAVYTRNLINIFPESSVSDARSKVTVYGKPIEGLPLFYTATTSYSNDAPDEVAIDYNLTTYDMVKDRAEELATIYGTTEKRGKGEAIFMPKLQVGDKIYIFAPKQNLQGWFNIPSFTHTFKSNKFRTEFMFQEEKKKYKTLENFLEDRVKAEQNLVEVQNEFNLNASKILPFTDSLYISSASEKVESRDNYLQLETGESSGTFISNKVTFDSSVTTMVLRVSGEGITGLTYELSLDDGVSYKTVNPNTEYTFQSGTELKIRIAFNSSTQKIKALGIEHD